MSRLDDGGAWRRGREEICSLATDHMDYMVT